MKRYKGKNKAVKNKEFEQSFEEQTNNEETNSEYSADENEMNYENSEQPPYEPPVEEPAEENAENENADVPEEKADEEIVENEDKPKRKKYSDSADIEPMGVGRWVGSLILLDIPIVNIVFFLMWFFGVGNRNRVQFVRANFIVFLIRIIIVTVIVIALLGTVIALFDQIMDFISSSTSMFMPMMKF